MSSLVCRSPMKGCKKKGIVATSEEVPRDSSDQQWRRAKEEKKTMCACVRWSSSCSVESNSKLTSTLEIQRRRRKRRVRDDGDDDAVRDGRGWRPTHRRTDAGCFRLGREGATATATRAAADHTRRPHPLDGRGAARGDRRVSCIREGEGLVCNLRPRRVPVVVVGRVAQSAPCGGAPTPAHARITVEGAPASSGVGIGGAGVAEPNAVPCCVTLRARGVCAQGNANAGGRISTPFGARVVRQSCSLLSFIPLCLSSPPCRYGGARTLSRNW